MSPGMSPRMTAPNRKLPEYPNLSLARARQEVNGTHRGANQSLDVPAEVRRAWRPVINPDAVLLSATNQCPGVEFGRIVELQKLGQTPHRPRDL